MKWFLRTLAVTAFFGGASSANAQDKKPDQKPFDDAEFVKMAASCNMHDVELGKIVAATAKNADVRKFGEMLMAEHEQCLKDLRAVAASAGIPLPERMLEKHQNEVQQFRNYKGDSFDQEFLKHTIKDHEEGIQWAMRASKEAKNAQLKELATKGLPKLKEHLEQAKKLQEQIKL